MMTHNERYELGLQRWTEITQGEVYVDIKVPTTQYADAQVLLGTQERRSDAASLQYMTADQAEMLGMLLILAAREYRNQEDQR